MFSTAGVSSLRWCLRTSTYSASAISFVELRLNVCKMPRFQDASSCAVQPNRSLQVPLTQKSCVKEAASSPFRKGSAMAGVGLSLNALKLSACKLPECKSLQCPALQRKSRPAWKPLSRQSENRQGDVLDVLAVC